MKDLSQVQEVFQIMEVATHPKITQKQQKVAKVQ